MCGFDSYDLTNNEGVYIIKKKFRRLLFVKFNCNRENCKINIAGLFLVYARSLPIC